MFRLVLIPLALNMFFAYQIAAKGAIALSFIYVVTTFLLNIFLYNSIRIGAFNTKQIKVKKSEKVGLFWKSWFALFIMYLLYSLSPLLDWH